MRQTGTRIAYAGIEIWILKNHSGILNGKEKLSYL